MNDTTPNPYIPDRIEDPDWDDVFDAIKEYIYNPGACRNTEVIMVEEAIKIVFTLIRKNRDYGSSVFDAPRLTPHLDPGVAIDVRLSDKLNRLEQLSRTDPEIKSESIDDTKLDIIGYLILQRVHRRLTVQSNNPSPQPNESEAQDAN